MKQRLPASRPRVSESVRGTERRRAQVAAAKVVPSAARETTPKAVLIEASPVSTTATGTPALSGVLANVALVNKIVGLCGGVENARPDYSLPLPPAVRPRTQANDLSGFVLLDRSGAEKPVCFE